MEKISWTDCVKTEEVLRRVKEGKNILHTVEGRKDKWIGHIICRNCLLKHVTDWEEEEDRSDRKRRKKM